MVSCRKREQLQVECKVRYDEEVRERVRMYLRKKQNLEEIADT